MSLGLLLAAWIVSTSLTSLVHRVRSSPGRGVFEKLASPSRSFYGVMIAHTGVAVFVIG